jgi:LVIVD repeat-containing protein
MSINRRRFLQAAGAGAGLSMTGGVGWAFHNDGLPLRQPSYGDIAGYEILGFNDMRLPGEPRVDGWDQTYEFRVIDQGRRRFAYCGNGQRGWSIVNVTNPRNMRVVWRQPHTATQHSATTDNTQYIDIKGGDILVVKRNKALETWDVRRPSAPVRLASYQPEDIHREESAPFHGLWVHEDSRGRFAISAFMPDGFSDHILDICDITNPTKPLSIGRWHYPGMRAGDEPLRTWWSVGNTEGGPAPAPQLGLGAPTVMCHDMTTWHDRCYVAWRDKGLIILDINNLRDPVRVGEVNWADQQNRPTFDPVVQVPAGYPPFAATIPMPPLPGQTHSWGMVNPTPGRRVNTIVGGDELGQCPFGYMHFIDVRDEARPKEISGFRTPLDMNANCPKDRLGNRMGIHDVERYIRGRVVHSAWEEGGFWGVDFSDIHYPKHAAY